MARVRTTAAAGANTERAVLGETEMFRRPFAATLLLASAAFFPVAAVAAPGYVDGSTELHAGPDYDYPTVAVIGDGEQVEVFGCLEDWSWCDVALYEDRGWIAGDHLASLYEGRRQPIAYVAPYIGLGILAFSFDTYWDNHYHARPWYRERTRWLGYTRDHHRPTWEGHRAGSGGNRDGHRDWRSDNDRNDNRNWGNRGGDRGRNNVGDNNLGRNRDRGDRQQSRQDNVQRQQQENVQRQAQENAQRQARENTQRQARENAQRQQENVQRQPRENPAGHMRGNPSGQFQGRYGQERVERAQAAPQPAPQAQPQAQPQPQAQNRGGGDQRARDRGGDRGGERGGGHRGGGDQGGRGHRDRD